MLKEDKASRETYKHFLQHMSLFSSFFVLTMFIYVFHIVQAATILRTYVTACAFISCGFAISESKKTTKKLWTAALSWFVYSVLYFDIRTHIQSYYYVLVVLFLIFPFFSIQKLYEKRWIGTGLRLLFWLYVFATPTLFANVYGNALYSIVKLLSVVLLLLADGDLKIEDYCWPLFCHPIFLLLIGVQIAMQVRRRSMHVSAPKVRENNDIIGYQDVPFLFNGKV